MNYWHELGADKNKLVMGMPMYGQTFTIGSSDEHGIGAPAPRGGGKKGRFTRQKGFASYYEVIFFGTTFFKSLRRHKTNLQLWTILYI